MIRFVILDSYSQNYDSLFWLILNIVIHSHILNSQFPWCYGIGPHRLSIPSFYVRYVNELCVNGVEYNCTLSDRQYSQMLFDLWRVFYSICQLSDLGMIQ